MLVPFLIALTERLKEGSKCLALGSRVQFIMVGKVWQREQETSGHTVSSGSRGMNAGTWLILLVIQSRSSAHVLVPYTFKIGLLSSVKPLWERPHGHGQMFLSCSKSSNADDEGE